MYCTLVIIFTHLHLSTGWALQLTAYTVPVLCNVTLCHQYSALHITKSTGCALKYTAYTVNCTPYLDYGCEQSGSVILRVDWVDKSDSLVHLCGSCIHWEHLPEAVVGEQSFPPRLSSRVVAQWRLLMKQPAEVLLSHPYSKICRFYICYIIIVNDCPVQYCSFGSYISLPLPMQNWNLLAK